MTEAPVAFCFGGRDDSHLQFSETNVSRRDLGFVPLGRKRFNSTHHAVALVNGAVDDGAGDDVDRRTGSLRRIQRYQAIALASSAPGPHLDLRPFHTTL